MGIDKMVERIDPTVRHMADGAAAATAVVGGLFVDNLNIIVLCLTALWTFIRIWETDTVKKLTGRYKEEDGEETDAK
jgi:hypothetical protein